MSAPPRAPPGPRPRAAPRTGAARLAAGGSSGAAAVRRRRAARRSSSTRWRRTPGDPDLEIDPALAVDRLDAMVGYLDAALRARARPPSCRRPRARAGRASRCPIALTFDDDLPSHVDHAAAGLRAPRRRRDGLPLRADTPFWWQLLQVAVDRRRDRAAACPHIAPELWSTPRPGARPAGDRPAREGDRGPPAGRARRGRRRRSTSRSDRAAAGARTPTARVDARRRRLGDRLPHAAPRPAHCSSTTTALRGRARATARERLRGRAAADPCLSARQGWDA